jgi:hypothetical protein
MQRIIFVWAGCLMSLAGCAQKPSNPLLEPERFAEVYAQVLIATQMNVDSTSLEAGSTTTKPAPADSALKALGVERRQFEAAVKYFGEHPKHWQEVYANVVKILEEYTKTDSVEGRKKIQIKEAR